MKRALLSLGALAVCSTSQAAMAGQVYLVGFAKAGESKSYSNITSVLIPMETMEQCQAAGIKMAANNKDGGNIQGSISFFRFGYDCIVGGK